MVIEVLSPSTAMYDKGPKSDFYRALPSLAQLLLVEQSCRAVYSLRHQEFEWVLPDLPIRTGEVELSALKLSLPLAEIYQGVELPVS